MMQYCWDNFAAILEEPFKLLNILECKFNPCKYLYDDIIANGLENEFKNFIYLMAFVKDDVLFLRKEI